MPTVSVNWQKLVYKGVEIDTTQPPSVFKCQLYDLTGVPPERQRIFLKGTALTDDSDWSKLGVETGQKILMIDSADRPVHHSVGLYNLGNTCYMNATMQCLHSVPELKSALIEYCKNNDLDDSSHLLTLATRELFNKLDSSVKAVKPTQFWEALTNKYPEFGEFQNGSFRQQDAEEFWTRILGTLSQSLTSPNSSVKQNFGIDLITRVLGSESDEDSLKTDSVYLLKCYISDDVNHLLEGLKVGLRPEKASGQSEVDLDSRINSLPKYLTIHIVRYKWVKESNEMVKILKRVTYPSKLDIFDLCTDDLCKTLETLREDGRKAGSSKATSGEGVEPLTGLYDLVAIITHKGRSAHSGHYVAWVKQEDAKWIEFDDDKLIPRREEDITNLSGGDDCADCDIAYICLYKAHEAIRVETLELPATVINEIKPVETIAIPSRLVNEIKPAAQELTLVANPIKTLKPFQLEGVKWLWYLHCKGEGGGILADEMGLGKTLQTCVFLVSLFKSHLVERVLVVVPAILVATWSEELQELGMVVFIFHGRKKHKELDCLMKNNGILITTYETLVRHENSLPSEWNYLILDEGHMVKNLDTLRSECIRSIHAEHRLILTGTPIERSIDEVWSVLNFCVPKDFNDLKEFRKSRSEPLGRTKKMFVDEEEIQARYYHALNGIQSDLQPYILRRLAADVLDLPKKYEFVVWLKLSRLQRELYKRFLRRAERAIRKACFAAIDIFKKVCDDPHLIQMADKPNAEADLEYSKDRHSKLLFSKIKRLMEIYADKRDFRPCKLLFLKSYVPEMCKNGHRVLIFAQRKHMLKKIEEMLKPLQCGRLDGSLSLKVRANTVKEFQAGTLPLLLIQSKVGSVGLTLTKADRVIVVDPAWNPSTDDQSVGRAYRQGQTNQVIVYRLITTGTVEERIYRKQLYKMRLAKLVLDAEDPYSYFTGEEQKTMFSLGNFDKSETQMELSNLHQINDSFVQSEINALNKSSYTTGITYHSSLFTKVASQDRDKSFVFNPKKVETHRNNTLDILSKRQTKKGAEEGLQKTPKVPSQSTAKCMKPSTFSSGGDHYCGRPSSPLYKAHPPKQRARQAFSRRTSPVSFGIDSKNVSSRLDTRVVYEKSEEVKWCAEVLIEEKTTLERLQKLQIISKDLSIEEVRLKIRSYLQSLGLRIDQIVIDHEEDLNKQERMTTRLWNYVSTFSSVPGAKLQQIYSKLKQEKGIAAGVGPSQINETSFGTT